MLFRSRPVTVGAAIIGPTVKGPVEVPTIVTTYNQFVNIFGSTLESGSANDKATYSYLTSIAAYNYFLNGGESMLVARVVSGSYTAASSSIIASGYGATTASFTLETLSKGANQNSTSTEVSGALESGSGENLRWQIVNPNTSSGTFNLLIRRGNDNPLFPVVLETWTNLSLDPNSVNFISKVIGDQVASYDSVNNQISRSEEHTSELQSH